MQNQEKCAEAENSCVVFTVLFFPVTARFGVIMIRLLKFNLCYQLILVFTWWASLLFTNEILSVIRARVQLCRWAFNWECGLFSSMAYDSLCRQRYSFSEGWWGQNSWRCFMGCLMFPRTLLFAIIWNTPQAAVSCPRPAGFGTKPCLKETSLGFARFIFAFSLAVFHGSNFLWITRRQRGSREIWLGSRWGLQHLTNKSRTEKQRAARPWREAALPFPLPDHAVLS